MAERGGFEPPVRLLTVQRFSKPPPSATRPSLPRWPCTALYPARLKQCNRFVTIPRMQAGLSRTNQQQESTTSQPKQGRKPALTQPATARVKTRVYEPLVSLRRPRIRRQFAPKAPTDF